MNRSIKDIALDVIESVGGDREFWATLDKLKDVERVIDKIIADEVRSVLQDERDIHKYSENDMAIMRTRLQACRDANASLRHQIDELQHSSWAISAGWEPVGQALTKLYEQYYAPDTPDSTRWVKIKETLEELMEAYDELLD
jgi:hypothetical protein